MRAKKVVIQNPFLDFESRLEMYVIKDERSFIFSIPSESFSVKIEKEQDFENFKRLGTIFGHSDIRSELASEMKRMIGQFESEKDPVF